MPCDPIELKHVPLFALFDDEELGVLAGQVELKTFRRPPADLQNGRPRGTRLREW